MYLRVALHPIASDHMDHLVAVDPARNFEDHINNFNHGDCSTNDDVLTWSPDYVSSANTGPFHSDKIMYMKNSTTKSFGYINSNGSVLRTNYTGLVSYKTIMQAMGAEANCLNDGWDRSFMGFDFEQMVDDECYAVENGTFKNMIIQGEYYINGVKQNNYVYQYNGQPVKVLSEQTNRYCGTKRTVSDGELYTDLRDANNNNAYLGKQLNTALIDELLANGYLPVDTKQLREWIKVGGCADGYFSDWIVTLTEAKTTTPPPPSSANIRVMAEDLSAGESGEDFDFNDVVFDVYFSDEVGEAYVMVQAAGGTLPLTVHGTEVHGLFNQPTNKMINTQAEKKGLNGISGLAPQKIQLTGITVRSKEEANTKIKIYVTKEIKLPDGSTKNEPIELVNSGAAACKIGVPPTTGIAVERTNVNGVLGSNEWVTNGILWPTN